jgi:hypothetical protein
VGGRQWAVGVRVPRGAKAWRQRGGRQRGAAAGGARLQVGGYGRAVGVVVLCLDVTRDVPDEGEHVRGEGEADERPEEVVVAVKVHLHVDGHRDVQTKVDQREHDAQDGAASTREGGTAAAEGGLRQRAVRGACFRQASRPLACSRAALRHAHAREP